MTRAKTYNQSFVITPSDTVNLSDDEQRLIEAVYVGATGNIVVVRGSGATETISGLLAGTVYPMRGIKRINSTNTTASNLRGMYQV